MGKVGSTSAYRALQALSSSHSIYHVHTLEEGRIRAAAAAYRATYPVRRLVPEHLFASRALLKDLKKKQPRGRWKVITVVRDPIARNMSSFFQDIELRHPDFEFNRRIKDSNTSQLVDDLLELFFDKHDHLEPLQWCDRELKGTLDIDVFSIPFSGEHGWQAYSSSVADLVLFRLEDLTRAWNAGVSNLLHAAPPALVTENDASKKYYAKVYSLFKKRIMPPPSYVDTMYNSRFSRHFYSSQDRERMAANWMRRSLT